MSIHIRNRPMPKMPDCTHRCGNIRIHKPRCGICTLWHPRPPRCAFAKQIRLRLFALEHALGIMSAEVLSRRNVVSQCVGRACDFAAANKGCISRSTSCCGRCIWHWERSRRNVICPCIGNACDFAAANKGCIPRSTSGCGRCVWRWELLRG
jgi:hypothetical protein